MIDEMPACERCVTDDLGDFTHYENFTATIEVSGHALDFDSRFPRMIKADARIMRAIVEEALTRAEVVDVIVNQGSRSRTNESGWRCRRARSTTATRASTCSTTTACSSATAWAARW